RNPTLRQAAAQVDATMSRSFQAGLYPNPTVGYVQEQIGSLGEVTPTASGITTRGRGTPGELVGGFVQQEIITGGKLRLSRAKFAARRDHMALRNAENHYQGSWENLVSLAGAAELRPTPLDDRPLDTTGSPLDFEATLADLLHRSPEIQAAMSEIRRSEIMVR